MSPVVILTIYCLLIVASSLFGGFLPSLMRLTHTRLQMMMSCVGGLMLGIGIFQTFFIRAFRLLPWRPVVVRVVTRVPLDDMQ